MRNDFLTKTKAVSLSLLLAGQLYGGELYVVANRAFGVDTLSRNSIKAIFLAQKHFVGDKKVLPLNYTADNPLRDCFERKILKKSRQSLDRYWLRAHYHGKRAPKVVKSERTMVAYLRKLPYAIGYIDNNSTLDPALKILFSVECP